MATTQGVKGGLVGAGYDPSGSPGSKCSHYRALLSFVPPKCLLTQVSVTPAGDLGVDPEPSPCPCSYEPQPLWGKLFLPKHPSRPS